MNALEREEDELVNAFNAGQITAKEFNDGMRAIRDEIRGRAQEAAERAYDEEMRRW